MGKLKKKLKKKVNPEKSNKMIIAVAIGLLLLLVVLYLIFGRTGAPVNKQDKKGVMEYALNYLKKGTGIINLTFLPDQNKVVIVYDENTEHLDFQSIARFASLKLSNNIPHEEVVVALVGEHDKTKKETYTAYAKDGIFLRMLNK